MTLPLPTNQPSDLNMSLRLIGDRLLVSPLYDPEIIGQFGKPSVHNGQPLVIPLLGKNPQSSQGMVVASGDQTHWRAGQLVVYMPYSGTKATHEGQDLLSFRDHQIVGHVEDKVLIPRPGYVVIDPIFEYKEKLHSGLWLIDQSVHGDPDPPSQGIIRYGAGEVMEGDRVLLPPNEGFEIGFIDKVVYVLPARIILAILETKSTHETPNLSGEGRGAPA